ncbi:MAG: hypothetical protein HFI72_06740 [Peptococcaceae bacterium]|jgi:flagellar basal body-associated protein FliL|nr:hypothetical protein [Peptococcaceae bacterium]
MGRSSGSRSFGGRSGGSRGFHTPRAAHTANMTRTGYRPYRSIFGEGGSSNDNDNNNHNHNGAPQRKKSFIIWLLLFLWFAGIGGFLFIDSHPVPEVRSTIDRTPLVGAVNQTAWYEDNLDWVIYEQVLIDGLADFYGRTGVQPFVLLVPYDTHYWQGNEIDEAVVDSYLNNYYNSHFTDEAHFLLAYFASAEDSITEMDGTFYYLCGYEAETVLDDEATDVFWTYLKYYYSDTSYGLEAMIGNAFADTATVIMGSPAVNTNGNANGVNWKNLENYGGLLLLILVVVLVVLILVILFAVAIGKREQRMLSEAGADAAVVDAAVASPAGEPKESSKEDEDCKEAVNSSEDDEI